MSLSPPPAPGDAPRSSLTLAVAGVVLALAAAGAWFLLRGATEAESSRTGTPPEGSAPGLASATRMDAGRTHLYATPEGMVLETVLSGTVVGETFRARLRDTQRDPQRPWVFVSLASSEEEAPVAPGRVDPKQVGRLELESHPTPTPGETRLVVRIRSSIEAVTIVDLRASGRWEGFAVTRSAAPSASDR